MVSRALLFLACLLKKWFAEQLVFWFIALLILTFLHAVLFRVLAPFHPRIIVRPMDWPEWMRWYFAWDQPIHIRCLRYMLNMLSFRFGFSFVTMRPVIAELWGHLQYTLLVFLPAFVFAILVSVPATIYSFARKGRALGMRVLTGIGRVFSWTIPLSSLRGDAHVDDYLLLRRAIGFDVRKTLWRLVSWHALPVALMVMAFALPLVVMGTMIVEQVFSLNGIGRWLVQSLMSQDRPVTEAVLFIYQLLILVAGFLVSLLTSRAK